MARLKVPDCHRPPAAVSEREEAVAERPIAEELACKQEVLWVECSLMAHYKSHNEHPYIYLDNDRDGNCCFLISLYPD